MTSDRPYRKGMPAQVAFDEVKNQCGKQFDPECGKAFIEIQDRIVEEMKRTTASAEGLAHALEAS
jgi:HD-GYP domain-containing protein (c-di-GMP phosphodiesterase class II)